MIEDLVSSYGDNDWKLVDDYQRCKAFGDFVWSKQNCDLDIWDDLEIDG